MGPRESRFAAAEPGSATTAGTSPAGAAEGEDDEEDEYGSNDRGGSDTDAVYTLKGGREGARVGQPKSEEWEATAHGRKF